MGNAKSWFLLLLGLIFITLKLTGHVVWSWWLVLAPIYIPAAVYVFAIVVLTVVGYNAFKKNREAMNNIMQGRDS